VQAIWCGPTFKDTDGKVALAEVDDSACKGAVPKVMLLSATKVAVPVGVPEVTFPVMVTVSVNFCPGFRVKYAVAAGLLLIVAAKPKVLASSTVWVRVPLVLAAQFMASPW